MSETWSRRRLGGALAGATSAAFLLGGKAAGVQAADPHRVQIKSFAFEPKSLTISVGEQVAWQNSDIAPHTATDLEGRWDSGELRRGAEAVLSFDRPGRYPYYCVFHPHMTGEIVVKE